MVCGDEQYPKMHISIPDFTVVKNGLNSYVIYNIYINGSFHCSLRYRQLHVFKIQLEKRFCFLSNHQFPSKKMFFLTPTQLEERRSQLEKYIQIISQESQVINSDIFKQFFLSAQQETYSDMKSDQIQLEIYQLNWLPVKIIAHTFDSTEMILKKYCEQINLDNDKIGYFSLYLVQKIGGGNYRLIRRLENLESPYLTLCTLVKMDTEQCKEDNYVILIKKSYWDNDYDEKLFDNRAALNIIYYQTLNDFEKGHIECDKETKSLLTSSQAKGDKISFLKIARTLKYYNYVHFEPCYANYPQSMSYIKVSVGNQKLCFIGLDSKEEYSFSIVRIKCWRLTTSSVSYEESFPFKGKFELSFEYLLNKANLEWITIYSSQAVQISNCLQSIVSEMVTKLESNKCIDSCHTTLNSSIETKVVNELNNDDLISSCSTTCRLIENNIFDAIGDDNL